MIIIPYRVDVPNDRLPVTNWLIAFVIVVVFAFQVVDRINNPVRWEIVEPNSEPVSADPNTVEEIIEPNQWPGVDARMPSFRVITPKRVTDQFVLNGWNFKGMIGHMWLHGGLIHMFGNLLFLWVFGNAVCSKINNLMYLPVYLLLGLGAAVGHLLFTGGAAIGASGAINGIVGMFLVFFPENDITCWFTFTIFYWRRFTMSSYWMILLWLLWDIAGAVMSMGASSGVAYFAHVGGFAVGLGVAVLMLKKGWIKMERYEKSLLELVAERVHPSAGEFRRDLGAYGTWESEVDDESSEVVPEAYQETQRNEPEQVAVVAEEPKADFIRFVCSCGKRVKVQTRYAGKVGRCPMCKKRVQIPGG